jgi:hypothetical protein
VDKSGNKLAVLVELAAWFILEVLEPAVLQLLLRDEFGKPSEGFDKFGGSLRAAHRVVAGTRHEPIAACANEVATFHVIPAAAAVFKPTAQPASARKTGTRFRSNRSPVFIGAAAVPSTPAEAVATWGQAVGY